MCAVYLGHTLTTINSLLYRVDHDEKYEKAENQSQL